MLRAGRRDVVLSRCHTGIFTGGDACSGVTWSVNLRSMVDIRDDGKPLSEGMCPEEGSRPSEASTPGWHVIEWVDLVPVALVLGVLLVVMIPRLPPGVCLGDSGDLQCASAVLGIAHPPGYGGYVSLGFLATCLPGVDHARAVTLMCAAAGVLAITLLVLLQIRLGVSPWLASAIGLALTVYPRVWANLTAAEVYAPTLALLAASAYLVTKYSFRGCLRNLLLAGICLGFAAGNRPPVALMWVGYCVALVPAQRRWFVTRRRVWRDLGLVVAAVLVPMFYSFAYLLVRDQPDTPVNYIEQYNLEAEVLPPADGGFSARLERAIWQATGRQYREYLSSGSANVWARLRYIRNEVLPHAWGGLAFALTIVVVGFCLVFRRCSACGWIISGIVLGDVFFVCSYRVFGDAADMLPMIWSIALAAGVGMSTLCPVRVRGARRALAMAIFLGAAGFTVVDAPHRWHAGKSVDATEFLSAVAFRELPEGSIICSSWGTSPALWYAKHVLAERDDVRIINANPANWLKLTAAAQEGRGSKPRPVFFTSEITLPPDCHLIPHRALFQLIELDKSNGR